MAIEDLDLEFEDEEEIEGSDALEVDVDLSFSAATESSPKSGKKPVGKTATNISALDDTNPGIKLPPKNSQAQQQRRPQAQAPQRKPTQQSKQASANTGNVKNIADHKAKATAQANAQANAQARSQSQVQAKVRSQQVPTVEAQFTDDYAYELQQLRDEIAELKTQMSSIQNQADVKVAVAQAKSEFVIDYVTDAKLVDHQVNQVLQRIHKRVPGLKTEVLTIKKAMSEFVEKTTKKKK